MARQFPIVRAMNVTATTGLEPKPEAGDRLPLWWVEQGTLKTPPIIRFCWQPRTGELRVGTQFRHKLQIMRHEFPFEAWLRGFSFQTEGVVALRTYFWPNGLYDEFDASHRRLDLRVTRSFLRVLRPHLPDRTILYDGVDNKFLLHRFSHLSRSW
jgi:hypothetical protein